MRRAADFGGAMAVGYLPDMFGHVAQMPQILRSAGFEHAVVWRGVPSAITKTAFIWEAPDGSSVRAEYLPFGYGNGALLPQDAKALVRRVTDHVGQIGPFLLGDLLLMNGSDHLPPQPSLGRVVAEANAIQDDLHFEITSLPEYLSGTSTTGLERWVGELRSGARANVLMGVTSNRVDVKRSVARAERALERRAEPYAALFQDPTAWPGRLLDIAWTQMVRNAAHDSICACSVDEVVDAVLHRAAEARSIADGLAQRALQSLGASMATPGPVVVNPSARGRSGLVELVVSESLPGDDRRGVPVDGHPDVQVVSERTGLPGTLTLDAQTVRTILGMIDGARIDSDAWVQSVEIDEDETGIDVTVAIGAEERANLQIAEAVQDLLTRLGARPKAAVRVRLDQPPIRRVVARVADVPGFGWQAFAPAPLAHPVTVTETANGIELSNGITTTVVDGGATFSVDGFGGMGALVDGGDLGDSYNYSPPAADRLIEVPESVTVAVLERGPVRARVSVVTRYRWPDHVDGASQRRLGEQEVTITTVVELRADEQAVRVTTTFVNPSRDHRLRLHLPLPEPAATSEAECAFATVVRGLNAEGRPDERGLPTFPARRFVRAGGLTVVHDGVVEYELVDVAGAGEDARAATLALTVLRSTGMLSRLGMSYRPFPAGPLTPVEGLQLVGRRIELSYAVAVGEVDPWAMADDVLSPLEVQGSFGGGSRPRRGSALEVTGAEVTAVRRAAGALEVRLFNPGDEQTTVGMGDRSGWIVDLRGRPLRSFDGSFVLGSHGIATVRLAQA
jgi:mannosylglycerate hydrolase